VLNGGPVAVTAAPATGRLKADPWQPPHHRANWPLPARGVSGQWFRRCWHQRVSLGL